MEIGDYRLGPLPHRRIKLGGRFRIEPGNYREGIFKQFLADSHGAPYAAEMLLGEQVEIITDNLQGCHRLNRAGKPSQLQQQAVAEVDGADSGGLQLPDSLPDPSDFIHRKIFPFGKGKVIGNRLEVAGKVAVIVEIPYDMEGYEALVVSNVLLFELSDKIFYQRRARGGDYRLEIIFRGSLGSTPELTREIFRDVILRTVVGGLEVAVGFGELSAVLSQRKRIPAPRLLLGGRGFQSRHLVDGLAYLVLEFGACHFEHPYITDLQRRKTQLLFLLISKFQPFIHRSQLRFRQDLRER